MKLFQELLHTNGITYLYICNIAQRDLLSRKSDGELTLVTGLTQQKDGKIYWNSGTYMKGIDDILQDYLSEK